MNKQEVIERLEEKKSSFNAWENLVRNRALDDALDIVKQLDEPEKTVVPQYVADMIVKRKRAGQSVVKAIENLRFYEDACKWVRNNGEAFVKAWLYGYEVEKERLYTVEIPNPNRVTGPITYLSRGEEGKIFLNTWVVYVSQNWKNQPHAQLTEAEIKKDFGWAWPFAEEVKE
ncbi:hypothetical protein Si110_00725 [Streptococcus infantarius subsp. infantarius]|nr:hypothetical protein [Streptococcus infantarius subsp. infantarius]MCO4513652.1 hypothetical protein [Streptococcus infantarius subsp. infantarius]MCO4515479.1 hypothetical protein [Streptococcus infantarius subsp. infantarius]